MMIPTLESNRKWGLPFAAVLGLLSVALVALFSVTSDRPKTTSAFLQRTLGENRDRAQMGDFPEEFSVSQESESKENYKRPFDYPRPRPAPVDSDTTTTTQSPSKRPNTNFPVPDTSTVPNGTSQTPTQFPSTIGPTAMTALTPTAKPTVGPTTTILAYKPGLINTIENGLHLSEGLTSRVIAISGQKVSYANGETSNLTFHEWPDGGEVFPDQRPDNEGGWILVSNSEEDQVGKGGVGAITFDSQGNVTNYQMILTGTLMNCNGGKTFFGGWVSCEEDFWSAEGQCWLTDPTGSREAKPISLGSDGGIFEAYAEDVRDMDNSHFFITEDDRYGAMQRWTPNNPNWNEPWQLLLGEGVTDYLVLIPTVEDHSQGNYSWTTDKAEAQNNAGLYYPNSEGIAISENTLFFVCKRFSHIYELDLDNFTYTRKGTNTDLFDGGPDQLKQVLTADGSSMLYFTEDGGDKAGIHARESTGAVHTILEGLYKPETTGLSFSPDGKRMYFAFQEDGLMFEIQRLDQKSFHATALNVKSHRFEGSEAANSRRKSERRRRN